jgi:hypothetical protein
MASIWLMAKPYRSHELHILALLAHPNVLCLESFAIDDTKLYLNTELGVTDLASLLSKNSQTFCINRWTRTYIDGEQLYPEFTCWCVNKIYL